MEQLNSEGRAVGIVQLGSGGKGVGVSGDLCLGKAKPNECLSYGRRICQGKLCPPQTDTEQRLVHHIWAKLRKASAES